MTPPTAGPDLHLARAHWVSRHLIVWPAADIPSGMAVDSLDWRLHWSNDQPIDPWAPEPVPWHSVGLTPVADRVRADTMRRFPHLSGGIPLAVPRDLDVRDVLRHEVAVLIHAPSGRLVNASGVQTATVLDELYATAASAELGVSWRDGTPSVRVWAPTARHVTLLLWPGERPLEDGPLRFGMERSDDGTWAATGHPDWRGARYQYLVRVYSPTFRRIVENRVTDPYSVALTVNSTHSVMIDLDDPEFMPQEWVTAAQPRLASPVDQVIYELHVRDFSMADDSLPADVRGTYMAFAHDGLGTRHLRRLAQAGLNSVQLMPIFDNSTVEESRARQTLPDKERLRLWAPDSDSQQAYVTQAGRRDAYNWGYDPWHYQAPEGSFATGDVVGSGGRVRQVRSMIGALHGMGLRVVLDQVFNHTSATGQTNKALLDRIVPGYYHRRDPLGTVYTSTCCPNVASEHVMAQKLMIDSCVLWARHYKVDGFRFDLMGHHSRDNMVAVREALDALTVERDGVDGRQVTMYGEGWNFGEVADNARFLQASSGQLGGTQIATFSDRLRDAVRGGGPFDEDPRLQGFGTGLMTASNGAAGNGNGYDQKDRLLYYGDLIQLGLAGNLRDVVFTSQLHCSGVRGDQIEFQGGPAGYADEPDEAVNYVDAHDNETLFDALAMKLPMSTLMSERVRANALCLAFATLGQNAVMWHAGTDFLRSKSLDRNSYDSGDWFNYLDFSMTDNGFGAGLPPAPDNAHKWQYMRPLLANGALKPSPADMRFAHDLACDLLRLRASTRLFRLGSAAQIRAKVQFPVSGTWAQVPGVLLMRVDDRAGIPVDDRWSGVTVVFNATPWAVRQTVAGDAGRDWRLHPVQAGGCDGVVAASWCDDGVFAVPGRTAAVFVCPR